MNLSQRQGSSGKAFAAMKLAALMAVVWVGLSLTGAPVQSEQAEISYDGLELVESTRAAAVYVDPEVDFSSYTRYMMLEPYVAFKKNWERDTRVGGRRVPKSHIDKMKAAAADLLNEAFKQELESDAGFPLVTEPGDDVLLLRSAIVDLVVTAPDVPTGGRSQQYTTSSIQATLYLEMFDSVTGDILARAIDRQMVRDSGYAKWTNSVTNQADARRIFTRWAGWLRESWGEIRDQNQAARKGS